MIKFCAAILVIVLVLNSCGNLNNLRVVKTNFDKEVSRSQNLVFTFNKEVIQDTSLLNRWDSTQYMLFSPRIPGKFMWTGKSELTFSPLGALQPSTNYKATSDKLLSKLLKTSLTIDDEAIEFHTPYTSLTGAQAFWSLSEELGNQIEVRCQLMFNNPVLPARLKPLLKVLIAGKEINYRIITQNESDLVEIAFAYNSLINNEVASGTIKIGKGLSCQGGSVLTTSDLQSDFEIPSKDHLNISGIETGFDNGKGYIDVFTTQPVVNEHIAQFVKVNPSVDTEIELMSNGFRIKGGFLASETYSLTIAKGIKGVFGRELETDFTKSISFGDPEPLIAFAEHNAIYLSTKGERNLGVNIINVPKVKVSVFKIFENNIQHYMRQGKGWDYNYDSETDTYSDLYSWQFDENYGKPVMSKEIFTRSLQKNGNISLLNLNLTELNFNESYKGLYLVKVESTDRKFLQDVQLVSLSDIGLIVKEGSADMMVFANSLRDASPIKGVKIDFISSNNQKVYSAISDNNGVVVFKNVKQAAAGFRISMVTARFETDFNFVLFDNTKVETSRFDAGGKRTDNVNYDVFIYGDRELYRPGDSVHVNTIVRTLKWEAVPSIPLKIKLLAPNGRVYRDQRLMLNTSGAAEAGFYIPNQAMTGIYLLEVYSANDLLLASRRISVEEFVPDRIKVTSSTNKSVYLPAESITLSVKADNLYGTPAAGRKFETELRLKRKAITVKSLPDYNFTVDSKNIPILATVMQQGTTGTTGEAIVDLRTNAYKDIGLLDGKIYTTVFDETGRPVNRLNVIEIPTQQIFFGIRNFDSWLSTRKTLNLQFAAVDRTGKIVPGATANVVVLHYKYETVIERDYGRYNYVSQKKEKTILSRELKFNTSGALLPFVPTESGEYEVRIYAPGSDNYVSKIFYAYGWSDTDYSSFEVNREGEVSITSDKNSYMPGDKARLLFKAPFDGQLLVTVEQENVLTYKYLTLENKSAGMDIVISKDHLPNIYIGATAFRKSGDMSIPLTVAHGLIPLNVEDASTRINVALNVPEKSRSGVRQVIQLKTIPDAEVTISVVDEGILQITDYKSPDPHKWFYQKRALGVTGYDVYALLYPELRRSSSPAGGEAFDLSRRINPLTGDRVKLISKWSGIRKTNSSGECSFAIDIPQFSGALRVMAVAYKGRQFGSAEKQIKVADPVVISMAVPRFLSPGDNSLIAVSMTNTTGKSAKATVSFVVMGALKTEGKQSEALNLEPGNEEFSVFSVTASKGLGNATILATVNAMGQKFTQQIDLPVRPAAGLSYNSGSGIIKAGSQKTIKLTSDYYPAGIRTRLVLSKSPAMEFAGNLRYLIRYPYGCLEQTVSAAFPQIYLSDMLKTFNNQGKTSWESWGNPSVNVQQAITKIESMQLYNGGMSLWPSGGSADWWATAYAAHFLTEARTAGFEVNKKVLDGILKYLIQKAKERETETYFYSENGISKTRVVPRREIIYSLYVLAINDMAPVSTLNYYKSMVADLTPEDKYLMSAALLLSGDVKGAKMVLPAQFGVQKVDNQFGGAYASFIRDKSIAANALLETDPANGQIAELLRTISNEVKSHKYLSTQETAFAMLAMGKHARKVAATNITAKVNMDGNLIGDFKGNDISITNDMFNKNVVISTQGSGNLYYYYELSGIPVSPKSHDEDNYIKVRRRFLDRNGNAISGNSFNQNDLIVVEVTAQATSGMNIENVAITDILPACFEIENSRLVAEREMSFTSNRSTPEYSDIRDDRISFFTTLSTVPKTFYYTVRVVNRGSFVIGSISADAMYNGEYHSYSGSGKVFVK